MKSIAPPPVRHTETIKPKQNESNIINRRQLYIFISLFLITQIAVGQVPSTYYDGITGTGYTLKTNLHHKISGHTVVSYNSIWTHFQTTDVDNYYESDGGPLDMYSENPTGADPYNWEWITQQCGNYDGEGSCYNREHSLPQSWFGEASPMVSDIFHIYLTDGYTNGRRSSYPFGEVSAPTWTSQNGSKLGPGSYPGYTGTVFEPIDEFKGDFARAYFYMATRYQDVISGWTSEILDGSSDKVFVDWYLNMMIEWHQNDPVSQTERDRNNAVYNIQFNANPFIDHPEWVTEIWGGGTINPEPTNHLTAFTATASGSSQIDLSWTDATGTNLPSGYLIMANTTGTFTAPVDGTDPATDADLSDGSAIVKVSQGVGSYSFTGLTAETTYYFKIWSYANSGANIDFKTDGTVPTGNATTETGSASTCEDFDSGLAGSYFGGTQTLSSGDWYTISVIAEAASDSNGGTGSAARINDDTDNASLRTPSLNSVGNVAFWYRELNSGGGTFVLQKSYDNSVWTDVASQIYSGTTFTEFSYNVNDATNPVYIRVLNHQQAGHLIIDDFCWTSYSGGSPTPTLTVNPITLTGFIYVEGAGPSTAQSFTVSGTDLSENITLAAPPNYEISLSEGSGYTSPITLTQSGGTVSTTTIYVRLKAGLSAAAYNGEDITASSTGVTSQTVTCSGEVTGSGGGGTCGTEDFVAAGNFGSYGTINWTGLNSVDWTATDARSDENLGGSEAIMLRIGSLSNDAPISGGCGTIEFDYAQIYTGSSTLKVYVNGVQYGGDIAVNSTASSPFSAIVNVSENISIEIVNSGNRTLVSNLTWTCYSSATSGGGSYSGTGTFTKITSIGELADGYYVMVNSGDAFAMNNTNGGSYFEHTGVSPVDNTIADPSTAIVWKIESHVDGGYTIYNDVTQKYVSYSGSSNAAYAVDAVSGANQRWNFTYGSNVFSIENLAVSGRILQYNAVDPRFACYTSSQQKLLLYKIENDGSLPIQLLHFTATPSSEGVLLQWATTTEINNDYFTLERSKGTVSTEVMAEMKGAGNSNETLHYSFTDNHPLQGISYYRLKQTDFDGSYEYSHWVAVNMTDPTEDGLEILSAFINHSQKLRLILRNPEDRLTYISIYDMQGREWLRHDFMPHHTITSIELALPERGVYVISVWNAQERVERKIIR